MRALSSSIPIESLTRRAAWLVLGVAAAAASSGCARLGVKPWERDLLAKPAMQLDAAPLASGIDDHIYFSKEAATGGRAFGGGGCGCN
ncbi:MAG: DUF4266 domain-containing protein [Betaproteobacteria bacterium]|nr:DUF4266 domain-containing protein [Betaproteobacteria bacterium]MCC6247386.1 DUF4266 domain-containing protein [Rubrivivax sp.]MCL4698030.1 DUF4266 domain-containing protein [Burkholderiaceae bacterium]